MAFFEDEWRSVQEAVRQQRLKELIAETIRAGLPRAIPAAPALKISKKTRP